MELENLNERPRWWMVILTLPLFLAILMTLYSVTVLQEWPWW